MALAERQMPRPAVRLGEGGEPTAGIPKRHTEGWAGPHKHQEGERLNLERVPTTMAPKSQEPGEVRILAGQQIHSGGNSPAHL